MKKGDFSFEIERLRATTDSPHTSVGEVRVGGWIGHSSRGSGLGLQASKAIQELPAHHHFYPSPCLSLKLPQSILTSSDTVDHPQRAVAPTANRHVLMDYHSTSLILIFGGCCSSVISLIHPLL